MVDGSQRQACLAGWPDLQSGPAQRFWLEAVGLSISVDSDDGGCSESREMPPGPGYRKAETLRELGGRSRSPGQGAGDRQPLGVGQSPEDLLRRRLVPHHGSESIRAGQRAKGPHRVDLAKWSRCAQDGEVRRPEIFLVPHTHWDREWYQPFDDFLVRLVRMMDGLIELLSHDDRFAHFHLDGQVAMIDDYLAVRPEREPDIRRLAVQGRISVGPWYTQMDEFLVSGESVVRNLEWGLERGRALAGDRVLTVGYLPDQFGHAGQMPQILRSHGIERAVVWRGVPAEIGKTAFWWESPDGSRVLTEYLVFSYSIGLRVGSAQDKESLVTELRNAIGLLEPVSVRDRLLITVGSDHQGPAAKLPPLLEEAAVTDGLRARVGSISEYLDGPDPEPIPTWQGELRSSARAHLLPGVYSTRAHQKSDRGLIELLVERVAEPLAALVPGFDWPQEELREAWQLLLWNGAHDSVCGCSVDQVARDVDARYSRTRQIAGGIVDRAMKGLAGQLREPNVVTFNPCSFERDGIPGLGWRVDAPEPVEEPIQAWIEGDHAYVGDIRIRLIDEGDVGDLYNFCPADDGPATAGRLQVVDGVLRASWDRLGVEIRATRRRGEPYVRMALSILNDRPDHRLRLHVGLKEPARGSVALAPFEVVERPLRGEGGTEVPSPTWPARGAAMAGGVAVLGQGVFEYEVLPDGELAVTLLRCVGTISRPQIATRPWAAGPDIATPDAQMIGQAQVLLAVGPAVPPEDLPSVWERFALPAPSAEAPGGGSLPASGSLLQVEGAQLSTVRRVDGGLEVRVWNARRERCRAQVGNHVIDLGPARIDTIRP
jgi:alpha-mannosidase